MTGPTREETNSSDKREIFSLVICIYDIFTCFCPVHTLYIPTSNTAKPVIFKYNL